MSTLLAITLSQRMAGQRHNVFRSVKLTPRQNGSLRIAFFSFPAASRGNSSCNDISRGIL